MKIRTRQVRHRWGLNITVRVTGMKMYHKRLQLVSRGDPIGRQVVRTWRRLGAWNVLGKTGLVEFPGGDPIQMRSRIGNSSFPKFDAGI
jgi:hypothetical protein